MALISRSPARAVSTSRRSQTREIEGGDLHCGDDALDEEEENPTVKTRIVVRMVARFSRERALTGPAGATPPWAGDQGGQASRATRSRHPVPWSPAVAQTASFVTAAPPPVGVKEYVPRPSGSTTIRFTSAVSSG